jgi:DNA-binding LacI/PurR family transcriptional regulator
MEEPFPARQHAPTIRDVARHAGVSVATVSRVLNDVPVVRSEMRERVRAAIGELGYRPSSTARSLSLGAAQAVGVVAPFFTSPSVVERLRGVVDRIGDRGYDLVLYDVETPAQRVDAFRAFARRARVDGLLVISLAPLAEEVAALRRQNLPLVLVDAEHEHVAHVAIDDVRGGELAAEHLVARGHRRIGFVGDVAANAFGFTSSERRRRGLRVALERAGIVPDIALELAGIVPDRALERFGRHDREDARALATDLLRRPDPPTAVFAASDTQAIGVLEAARALGHRVPDDVAVIGFDDIEVASLLDLTPVRQPLRQSGARGADLLLGAIDGAGPPPAPLEPLAVVARGTT